MNGKIRFLITGVLLIFCQLAIAQVRTITGKVVDGNKNPMPGVSVLIKGTSKGIATDFDGLYSIEAKKGATLVFSYVGFTTKEVKVGSSSKIDIVLKEDAQELGEVVVVGFGTQKKENLTGAVATVDTKVLESRPVSNVTQALQGAVAGMNFNAGANAGQLNGSLSFNIRGTGTIGSGTNASPLVLIDGVEGDINALNPQDIENISVLKDAASSSIYGSRAAFGVVLVTTKSGREGDIVINYTTNYRLSSPAYELKTMDSEDFAYYFNDAAANKGGNPVFSKETIEKIIKYKKGEIDYTTEWDPGQNKWKNWTSAFNNINWYKEFYRDQVPSLENNISIRGGNKKTNFFLSTNWLNQEGLMKYNTEKRDRYTVNSRISSQLRPYLKLTYGGRFTRIDFSEPKFLNPMFFHNVGRKWPTVPLKDKNGNYVIENSVQYINAGRTYNQKDEFVQQLELILEPVKNWRTHVQLNYKTDVFHEKQVGLRMYDYDEKGIGRPAERFNAGKQNVQNHTRKSNFFNPNIFTEYVTSVNEKHNFKVMTGFQSELYKAEAFGGNRQELYTPRVQVINGTYGEDDNVWGDEQQWSTAGFFGRLNYDYKGIYLLELNGRYDGTSRFLSDKRWNLFPSASIGYNISKEDFFKGIGETAKIDLLKLRASYGVLGNQNTNNWYPFYPKMKLGVANGAWLVDGEKTNISSNPDLVSALLTWERVKSWNLGLDLKMFDNRLSASLDLFKRITYDMVGPAPQLPAVLGTAPARINNTDMESKGFELELSWRDYVGDDFSYGIKATLTDSRQFVTRYPNETGSLSTYYVGRELGQIWGYETVGIAKTNDEMNKHLEHNKPTFGSKWAAGDIMYKDLNGDGEVNDGAYTLDDHGDVRIIGNSTPRYNFGINLDFQYKGFDFSAFLQGTAKRDLSFSDSNYFSGANKNMWQVTGYDQHLDYFRPENTTSPFGPNLDAYYPRPLFEQGGKNFETQTRWLQNGAYIRLKNIQVGYTFPKDIMQSIGVRKLRIYVSAENTLTFTKMIKIFDPEAFSGVSNRLGGAGKTYPISKVFSTGLSLTF